MNRTKITALTLATLAGSAALAFAGPGHDKGMHGQYSAAPAGVSSYSYDQSFARSWSGSTLVWDDQRNELVRADQVRTETTYGDASWADKKDGRECTDAEKAQKRAMKEDKMRNERVYGSDMDGKNHYHTGTAYVPVNRAYGIPSGDSAFAGGEPDASWCDVVKKDRTVTTYGSAEPVGSLDNPNTAGYVHFGPDGYATTYPDRATKLRTYGTVNDDTSWAGQHHSGTTRTWSSMDNADTRDAEARWETRNNADRLDRSPSDRSNTIYQNNTAPSSNQGLYDANGRYIGSQSSTQQLNSTSTRTYGDASATNLSSDGRTIAGRSSTVLDPYTAQPANSSYTSTYNGRTIMFSSQESKQRFDSLGDYAKQAMINNIDAAR